MKLTADQLNLHLTKNLAPIYLLCGDEPLLKQESWRLIRHAAKQAGFVDRDRITPESGFAWEELYATLHSHSLLATKQFIELDLRLHTPNKIGSTILTDYGKTPSPQKLLVIDLGKVDAKLAKSEWYKTLEKAGVVVTHWPIARKQLPQWIMQRAQKYKLQFKQDAALVLADLVEGNLVAARDALEKIYLLKPNQPIDIDMVKSVLSDEGRFTIFDFIESLIAGDMPRAFRLLTFLQTEGAEPTLILWGITRELRLLAELAEERQQGVSFENLWQQHRIFSTRQASIRQFLTTHTKEDCWHYLMKAADIDQVIKGAISGNVWEHLELFCLRMAM